MPPTMDLSGTVLDSWRTNCRVTGFFIEQLPGRAAAGASPAPVNGERFVAMDDARARVNVRQQSAVVGLLTMLTVFASGDAHHPSAALERAPRTAPGPLIERKTCKAPDGVTIVYSAAGAGEPALVFIHGGLANRGFWDHELAALAAHHRVIAPDLPGHGESGSTRKKWGIPEFGADVRAVIQAEHLGKVIIFGNSLGGPVAIEAALLLPGKVIGVVGVDTYQNLTYATPPEDARKRAEAFRADYEGSLKQMVSTLFHPDADSAVVLDAERRMALTSPAAAYQVFLSLGGYAAAPAARRLKLPLRAINGDRFPTDIEAIRKVHPDFDAVIMKHMGHYPMLERPDEFDHLVTEMVARLSIPIR